MKRLSLFAMLFCIAAGFALAGCSSESSGSGGSGADFDASLYYTKTDVDSLLLDVVQEGGGTGTFTAEQSFADAATLTPPAGANGVLVKIYGNNTTGSSLVLGFRIGTAEDDLGRSTIYHGTVGTGYFTVMGHGNFTRDTASLYVWQDTGLGDASDDFGLSNIYVQPVAWFK